MHAECQAPPGSALVDLNVVDCHDRVVISAPSGCRYVALSYVWGKPNPEDTPQFPCLPDKLPRTVEDSIDVTMRLGYRYLWVDRYCIDQNNKISQQHQIKQMGTIYSSAQITIIAAAGTDATCGLPGLTCVLKNLSSETNNSTLGRYETRVSIAQSERDSVWYTRGWTFQEEYLSKRRMYFTAAGSMYVCDDHYHFPDLFSIMDSLRITSTTACTISPGSPGIQHKLRMIREYILYEASSYTRPRCRERHY